jgi:N-acetylglucosaminyldiphosphoundecaprenol N-acetyl-beta-D-mannosaminyltransferase
MPKTQFFDTHSERKYGRILDIPLNSTSVVKVLAFVRDSLARRRKFYIVTPNPEIVLLAQKDPLLKRALTLADIAVPDGVGLSYASSFLGLGKLNPIKGRELFMELVTLANKKGWNIFLMGGEEGIAEKVAQNLSKGFKSVKIAFSPGARYNLEGEPINEVEKGIERETLEKLNEFKPELLFVGLGAPKQEKWILRNLKNLNIGGAMAVGGTLDYIAGKASLPPKRAEKRFEWLYRLYKEPKRVKRIFRAVIVFPLRILVERLKSR